MSDTLQHDAWAKLGHVATAIQAELILAGGPNPHRPPLWPGQYLIGRTVAHYWTGSDTVCGMASTGSLSRRTSFVSDADAGMLICKLCDPRPRARKR